MCNCTSENLEIPGSRFRAPRNDVSIANLHVAAAALNRAALRGGPELKVAATGDGPAAATVAYDAA